MGGAIMDEKIINFTCTSGIATKEFQLEIIDKKYILGVCAYGSWWEETFFSLEDLKIYLKIEWGFDEFSFLKGLQA